MTATKATPKYKIRFAQAGRRPPIVNLRSPQLERNHGRFYIETRADVSLIKKNKINKYVSIDQACVVSISGVTPGECATLGSVNVEINGFVCEAHIVPEDFPIDTDGLLGWDMLMKHEAKINAVNKRLEVGRLVIPFEKEEQFVIPPHTQDKSFTREFKIRRARLVLSHYRV